MEKEQHLTIDGKVMICFFSEIVFILLLKQTEKFAILRLVDRYD